jgi:hypothetical protein
LHLGQVRLKTPRPRSKLVLRLGRQPNSRSHPSLKWKRPERILRYHHHMPDRVVIWPKSTKPRSSLDYCLPVPSASKTQVMPMLLITHVFVTEAMEFFHLPSLKWEKPRIRPNMFDPVIIFELSILNYLS